jgi:DNA-binding NarL/FixJ family response regulator
MRTPFEQRRSLILSILLLAVILVVVSIDLAIDYAEGVGAVHVALEGTIFALALGGITYLSWRWMKMRRETRRLAEQLETEREDAKRWRREAKDALEGLGAAIDRQFDRWELTPAEREVALLLLKGFSHKEIAGFRDVSDRTVRQQAHAVYNKADVSGRAELSAFFLEDLLLPGQDDDSDSADA